MKISLSELEAEVVARVFSRQHEVLWLSAQHFTHEYFVEKFQHYREVRSDFLTFRQQKRRWFRFTDHAKHDRDLYPSYREKEIVKNLLIVRQEYHRTKLLQFNNEQ